MDYVLADTKRFGENTFLRIDYRAVPQETRDFRIRNKRNTLPTSDVATRFNTELHQSLTRAGFEHYAGRFTSPQVSPVWRTSGQAVFAQYDALRSQHVDEIIASFAHTYFHEYGISPAVFGREEERVFRIKPQTIRTLDDAIHETALLATIYEESGGTHLAVHTPPGVLEHVQRRLGAPLRKEEWQEVKDWTDYRVWSEPEGLPDAVYDSIVDALKEVAVDTAQQPRVLVLKPGERPEVLASRVA